MDYGQYCDSVLDNTLFTSWRRCRDMGVEPSGKHNFDLTPENKLEPFLSMYHAVALDVENRLYSIVRDKNQLITVTDDVGRLIRTRGSRRILKKADKLNFVTGADWTESAVGTNAIGTTLFVGKPQVVLGSEHYCRTHQAWNCSAAPIIDPYGNIWGCLDISGPCAEDHRFALGVVIKAAHEIEHALFRLYISHFEKKYDSLLTTISNVANLGVLVADHRGIITYSNKLANILLGEEGGMRGQRADAHIEYDFLHFRQKTGPAHEEFREDPVDVRCLTKSSLTARVAPVFDDDNIPHHTVVMLSESRHTHIPGYAPRSLPPVHNGEARWFGGVYYRSHDIAQVVRRARQAAQTPSTLLLLGETGTGKELFARAIHEASPRATGPFVPVNCGAFPRELIQSELFGYKGGAFTGAHRQGRVGKFRQADQGTLFLDEISEMPLDMQINLLRPLSERRVNRVGDEQEYPVDVKVVIASNRNLSEMVDTGAFRRDLFYRINVVTLHIPPLRQRKEDICLLAEYYARKFADDFRLPFKRIDPAVMEIFLAHAWPGNVRELIHCVECAINVAKNDVLCPDDLPNYLTERGVPASSSNPIEKFNLTNTMADTIREALRVHNGNVSKAARALGIGRNTLYAKLQKINAMP
ncbi:MAG: sigma-54-dependent Fis family transcriptional regulator [Desulfovibrio sp.]|nr:sigma-54-dependent Fis family transcriptional regulator [Desulfovibrio sp.]